MQRSSTAHEPAIGSTIRIDVIGSKNRYRVGRSLRSGRKPSSPAFNGHPESHSRITFPAMEDGWAIRIEDDQYHLSNLEACPKALQGPVNTAAFY